jgi:pyruvate formate lyase activating enzyme
MEKGMIFDIKRYAIHDGPGIRTTVFFKGCPLRCQWCHNPEGVSLHPELLINQTRCEENCEACLAECPQGSISKHDGRIAVDFDTCNLCGRCTEVCAYEALTLAGNEVTVSELLTEVEKDRIFFDESTGGVTISGGEPFEQLPFLLEFLYELKARDIHVSLDTSGYAPFEELMKAGRLVELILYDLKMMNSSKHENYTGVPNDLILDNLTKLSKTEVPFEIRIPLIAGVNDDAENIGETIAFCLSLPRKPKVSLLPYHRGGCEKYIRLVRKEPLPLFESPSEEIIAKIMRLFGDKGFSVKRGG